MQRTTTESPAAESGEFLERDGTKRARGRERRGRRGALHAGWKRALINLRTWKPAHAWWSASRLPRPDKPRQLSFPNSGDTHAFHADFRFKNVFPFPSFPSFQPVNSLVLASPRGCLLSLARASLLEPFRYWTRSHSVPKVCTLIESFSASVNPCFWISCYNLTQVCNAFSFK